MSLEGSWDRRGMDRRRFLGRAGMGAGALALYGSGFSESRAWARPSFAGDPFSLGVASGDPLSDGVVLWTRLAPEPLAGDGRGGMPEERKVPVRFEVASDERFRDVVRRGRTFATPELGHSVHVEVEGLAPGREYFYRFKAGRETSPVGRTKTAPAPGRKLSELTFAFASCQQFEHGYFTAYKHLAEEDLDLVVHLGDYIYEYGTDVYLSKTGNVRHHIGDETDRLAEYRQRHSQYRTDADLQAAHAAFPWVVTTDDHEVENNYADEISERNSDPRLFLLRRADAYQAYYEHMPLRRSSLPSGPDMRLYRRLTYGDLASFNVLDTRQYRDDQAAGDGTKPPNPEQQDPSRTLTGATQERWLLDGLTGSSARWNVLAQQVFFAQRDFDPGDAQRFSMDTWDGYVGSRQRLLDAFEQRSVRNPIVLTGDVHANWACNLLSDFDDPESEVVGTEFVGTSITSGGNGSDLRADTAEVLAENPHIKFFNDLRGYVRCRLTRSEWRSDYRVVPFVTERDAPVYTRATYVVGDGNPGAERDTSREIPRAREMSAATEADRIEAQERLARPRGRRGRRQR